MKILKNICFLFAIGSTFTVQSQNVGINSSGATPDASAILDVVASDKGLLIPRVTLTGTTDVTTISTATNSLLVYNSATVSDVTPGYYYWDNPNTKWVRLLDDSSGEQDWFGSDDEGPVNTAGEDFYTGSNVGIGGFFANNLSASPVSTLHVRGINYTGTVNDKTLFSYALHGSGSGTSTVDAILGHGVSNSGSGTENIRGVHGIGEFDFTSGSSTSFLYGVYGEAYSEVGASGTQTAIGGFFTAFDADNNYALLTDQGYVGIGTLTPLTKLEVSGTSALESTISVSRYSNDANDPQYFFLKSRGTETSPIKVSDGDRLGTLSFKGKVSTASTNSSWKSGATIYSEVEGTSISTSSMPGNLILATTPTGSNNPVARISIASNGDLTFGNANGVMSWNNTTGDLDLSASGISTADLTLSGDILAGIDITAVDDIVSGGHVRSAKALVVEGDDYNTGWDVSGNSYNGIALRYNTAAGIGYIQPGDYNGTTLSPKKLALYASSVGVNMTPSATYALDVTGGVRSTTGVYATSDLRYKKNVLKIDNALNKISQLEGVSYYFKTEGFSEYNFPQEKQIGVIAQDLEMVLPELVKTDEDGYKAVNYSQISAVLIEAIKELKTQNEALLKRIEALEKK